jgi:hypothetical protein
MLLPEVLLPNLLKLSGICPEKNPKNIIKVIVTCAGLYLATDR